MFSEEREVWEDEKNIRDHLFLIRQRFESVFASDVPH
jgi:hypothetical protein